MPGWRCSRKFLLFNYISAARHLSACKRAQYKHLTVSKYLSPTNRMRYIATFFCLVCWQVIFAQKSLNDLRESREFNWIVDSSSKLIVIYCQQDSWASKRLNLVKQNLLASMESAKAFIGIESYGPRIHFFIAQNRSQMKSLVGFETNGKASPFSGLSFRKSHSEA